MALKQKQITFWVSIDESEQIKTNAQMHEYGVSDYVRRCALLGLDPRLAAKSMQLSGSNAPTYQAHDVKGSDVRNVTEELRKASKPRRNREQAA